MANAGSEETIRDYTNVGQPFPGQAWGKGAVLRCLTPGHARLEANRAPNGMDNCRHGAEDDSGLFLAIWIGG